MATPEKVTELRPLPATVAISQAMSLTPNDMRQLKAETGQPLSELLGGGDAEDLDAAPDRIQALVWIQLRRNGYAPSWDEAGDVAPDFTPEAVDPSNGGR